MDENTGKETNENISVQPDLQNEDQSEEDIISVRYLDSDQAEFKKSGDFTSLKLRNRDGKIKEYPRINLHRAFPFDNPYSYISVSDDEKNELGIIRSLDDFDEKTAEILKEEIDRKYFTPEIVRIISIKESFGFSQWNTVCSINGVQKPVSFTLRDTFRSLLKAGDSRIYVNDMDGNRYEIPDIERLDKKSYKKIEIYL